MSLSATPMVKRARTHITRANAGCRRVAWAARPLVLLALAVGLGACASPPGPTTLEITADDYPVAFDAAVNALRDAGFVTAVRDRSGGVIESEPLRIGGALEPWDAIGQPWSVTGESTLSLQRRRVRVEFVPDGSPQVSSPPSDVPAGADMIGAVAADLRTLGSPLRMRVWVALERAHTPGIRRFTWTRSLTTRSVNPVQPINPGDGVVATSVWTPIGRDQDTERRLTAQIGAQLGARPGAQLTAANDAGP